MGTNSIASCRVRPEWRQRAAAAASVWGGFALLGSLASCVAPRQAPPEPQPAPRPALAPLPAPAPVSDDWRDIPQSPGAWRYAAEAGGTAARFGPPGAASFVVRCTLGSRLVTLSRETGTVAPAPLLDIITSSGRQTLRGAVATDRPAIEAVLPARDPFLDKMAFSRGRFIVAVSGTARLAIPAWAEFARVVEDCR